MIQNRLVTLTTISTGAFALAYVAGWFIIAQILKSGIGDWIVDRRNDGWTVEYGTITTDGFPYSWRASIAKPNIGLNKQDRDYRWSGPAITLNWIPWSPRTAQSRAVDRGAKLVGILFLRRGPRRGAREAVPVRAELDRGRPAGYGQSCSPGSYIRQNSLNTTNALM